MRQQGKNPHTVLKDPISNEMSWLMALKGIGDIHYPQVLSVSSLKRLIHLRPISTHRQSVCPLWRFVMKNTPHHSPWMFSTRGVTDHINRTAYDEADYCHSNAFSTLFFVISMAAVIEAIKVSLRGGGGRREMRFSWGFPPVNPSSCVWFPILESMGGICKNGCLVLGHTMRLRLSYPEILKTESHYSPLCISYIYVVNEFPRKISQRMGTHL